MKKFLNLIIFNSLVIICNGQTFPWAKSGSGLGYNEAYSVCTDATGNVYITGGFGGPTMTFTPFVLTNAGAYNVFLTKYDSNGNVLWAKSAGGNSQDFGNSVCTDIIGNVFITGIFSSTVMTIGTTTLTKSGYNFNIFLAKYDTNGNLIWARSAGGNGPSGDKGNSITTDASGNVYLTGSFSTPTITFGTNTVTAYGAVDLFITKYDTNGNVLWAKSAGGASGNEWGNSVSTDASGNIFVTGTFNSSNVSIGTYTLSNPGFYYCSFISKYDSNGNVIWAQSHLSTPLGNDFGNSVSTDPSGNVFITGSFSSSKIAIGTNTLVNIGGENTFFAKYDNNGNVLWAKSFPNSDYGGGYCVSADNTGNVYISGSFSTAVTIGSVTFTPSSGAIDPMFLAKYDGAGNVICASILDSGGDDLNSISADKFGNAYFGGDYLTSPFVVGSNTLTGTGSEEIFIAKYFCPNVGISETSLNSQIKIFPNPNNGYFNLQLDMEIENAEIILINLLGQKVYGQKIYRGENKIISVHLASGLYNYFILQDKRQISNGKITVE